MAQLNGAKWALYTFGAIFLMLLIAATVILTIMIVQDPELQRLINEMSVTGNEDEVKRNMQAHINFLNELLMFFAGLGGYLFVKYLLDKKIGNNNNNIFPAE